MSLLLYPAAIVINLLSPKASESIVVEIYCTAAPSPHRTYSAVVSGSAWPPSGTDSATVGSPPPMTPIPKFN